MSTDPRFFEFDSAKQALDEIALFKIRMVGNVDIVYTQPFLRCAAAVLHFEPGEFLRLIIILKRELKRTGGISRWQDTVDRLGSLERDRLKALQNPRRNDSGSTGGERGQPTIEMKAITPWPQSVPAGPLFDAIETFVNRFVRLNKDQTVAIVLWIAFTHVFDVADVSPRLALISPKKRCGKSTVERVLSLLMSAATGRVEYLP